MSLKEICLESIATSISNAPEIIQEEIYGLSLNKYKNKIKNKIKKEFKKEIIEEILEELYENYLLLVPSLIREASTLILNNDVDDIEIKNIIKNSSINLTGVSVDPDMIDFAVKCARESYDIFKDSETYDNRLYRYNQRINRYNGDDSDDDSDHSDNDYDYENRRF